MALPSQNARTASTGRSYMARKSRLGLRPLAIAGLAVGVIAVAGWAMTRKGEGHQDTSPPALLGPKSAAAATPKAEPKPEPPPPKVLAIEQKPEPAPPPVFELRQGVGQPGIVNPSPETPSNVAPAPAPVQPKPAPAQTQATPASEPKPAPAPASNLPSVSGLPTDLAATLSAAKSKDADRDWVAARFLYSRALADSRLSDSEKASIRDRLTAINDELIFSPKVVKDDPYAEFYTVQSGDNLIKVAQRLKVSADWRLLKRINRLGNANAIGLGQKLKVVQQPFHAVIYKSAFRMDTYLGPADRPEQWVYVRSFRVGLGDPNRNDGTPVGGFIVKKGSKLVDPPWIHPDTGERFAGGAANNPIGRFWIGLEGQDDSAAYTGYGIHGTIEPESIGQQKSMGCIRMLADDIALMYELMGEQVSTVQIRP